MPRGKKNTLAEKKWRRPKGLPEYAIADKEMPLHFIPPKDSLEIYRPGQPTAPRTAEWYKRMKDRRTA